LSTILTVVTKYEADGLFKVRKKSHMLHKW